MYTYKRLFTSVFIALILCCGLSIYAFEKVATISTEPLMTYLHTKDNYDYSISIPTYWSSVKETTHDIMFSGNNYEYFSIDFLKKEKTYDKDTYGAFMNLKISEKYKIENPKIETFEKNGLYIYKTVFNMYDNNYIIGYVDCNDFLFEFEYKRTDKNDINKNLDNIIASIRRFEVKEVTGQKED
mgnify:CR=1 FL=1